MTTYIVMLATMIAIPVIALLCLKAQHQRLLNQFLRKECRLGPSRGMSLGATKAKEKE